MHWEDAGLLQFLRKTRPRLSPQDAMQLAKPSERERIYVRLGLHAELIRVFASLNCDVRAEKRPERRALRSRGGPAGTSWRKRMRMFCSISAMRCRTCQVAKTGPCAIRLETPALEERGVSERGRGMVYRLKAPYT